MKIIYAIAGRAGAGKDTTASMLAFLHHGYIVDGDKFQTWEHADLSITNRHIFHFADTLKKVIKLMYGLQNFHLNDRKYKDELYFNLNTYTFDDGTHFGVKDEIIKIEQLEEFGLNKVLSTCNILGHIPHIKLRTLLQYIGTNLCRRNLDDHIWTKSTINKLHEMLHNVNDVYIADMRFDEEFYSLTNFANKQGYKLVTIFIERPDNDCTIHVNHQSENIYLPCTYKINNNGTLEDLFNKVKEIYDENC